jgi:hypothetical protein
MIVKTAMAIKERGVFAGVSAVVGRAISGSAVSTVMIVSSFGKTRRLAMRPTRPVEPDYEPVS